MRQGYYSDKGTSSDGTKLEIVDEMKAELHTAAAGTTNDRLSFLKLESVFGNLADKKTFTEKYTQMVGELYENPDIAQLMQALLFGRE